MRQSLLFGDEPLAIDLPPAPHGSGRGRLVARLAPVGCGDSAAGTWEFSIGAPLPAGRLIVSPGSIDQGFLLLDHPASPPLAQRCHAPVAGEAGAFDLTLRREWAWGGSGAEVRLQPSADVRERLLCAWRVAQTPPVEWFYVELTSYCNLRCSFCPSKDLRRKRAFLSPEHARVIFERIGRYCDARNATYGYTLLRRMVFLHVMGEPLLHPQFVACVRLARDAGLVPALFTNASLLTAPRIDAIFEAGVAHVTLSINTFTEDGYHEQGGPGTLAQQEQRAADLLRRRAELGRHGVHVDIQYMTSAGRTVAGRGLLQSPEEFWHLYRRWLLLVRQIGGGRAATIADPDAVTDPLAPAGDPSRRFPLAEGVDLVVKSGCSFGNATLPKGYAVVPAETGRCPFDSPSRQMCVYCDGSVSFCSLDAENSVQLGNLLEQSVEEIWGGERMRSIRAAMAAGQLTEPLCQRCLGTVVPTHATPHGGIPA